VGGMEHGAWGMELRSKGHGAKEQGAWSMEHGAWGLLRGDIMIGNKKERLLL